MRGRSSAGSRRASRRRPRPPRSTSPPSAGLTTSTVGAAIAAADLALGEHTVSATARGAGGEATAERTVVVTVTPEGLRARVAVLDLPPGQLVNALGAVEAGRWESVRRTLEKFVDDEATRERLLEEIDHLADR